MAETPAAPNLNLGESTLALLKALALQREFGTRENTVVQGL